MEGFIRPEAVILPEVALIPPECVVAPPPNQFTHEVTNPQPFFFSAAASPDAPSGEFAPGTKVNVLLDTGSEMCRVVDGRGLYVLTARTGLRRLSE